MTSNVENPGGSSTALGNLTTGQSFFVDLHPFEAVIHHTEQGPFAFTHCIGVLLSHLSGCKALQYAPATGSPTLSIDRRLAQHISTAGSISFHLPCQYADPYCV